MSVSQVKIYKIHSSTIHSSITILTMYQRDKFDLQKLSVDWRLYTDHYYEINTVKYYLQST